MALQRRSLRQTHWPLSAAACGTLLSATVRSNHLKISRPCTAGQTNALLMSRRNADALSLRKLPFPAFNAVFSKSCTRQCSSVWGWPTTPLPHHLFLSSSSFHSIIRISITFTSNLCARMLRVAIAGVFATSVWQPPWEEHRVHTRSHHST